MVEARLFSARLGVFGPVTFLIDTGADFTTLHPSDAANLGIDYATDFAGARQRRVGGVGGEAVEFDQTCQLFLDHTNGDQDQILFTIGIAPPTPSNLRLPSLLGRDVLKYYRLTFQESANLVVLQRLDEL